MSDSGPWSRPPSSVQRSRRLLALVLVLAGVAALVVYLVLDRPGTLDKTGAMSRLGYMLILLVAVGSAVILNWRAPAGRTLKYAALWLAIGAVLAIEYSFRYELGFVAERVVGALDPAQGVESAGAVTYHANRSGHFVIAAEVEGEPVLFLVDTGASDVVLSPADAARLGFDLNTLDYSNRYRTANGIGQGAPVVLAQVALGPIRLDDVQASVNLAAMDVSLLGMSFLSRLAGYEVAGERLTLRP